MAKKRKQPIGFTTVLDVDDRGAVRDVLKERVIPPMQEPTSASSRRRPRKPGIPQLAIVRVGDDEKKGKRWRDIVDDIDRGARRSPIVDTFGKMVTDLIRGAKGVVDRTVKTVGVVGAVAIGAYAYYKLRPQRVYIVNQPRARARRRLR